nr:transposase, MuDR [Tanacetum cinerariifolium]
MFTLKVNHGGVFTYVYGPKRTRAPICVYKGMVKGLGYENPEMKFYYKKPTAELDTDLDQEDDRAGLGIANENVEEFDPLFSYPRMQTDDLNEGVDHTKGDDNNEGVNHTEVSDNNERVDHTEVSDNNEGDNQTESSDDNEESDDSNFESVYEEVDLEDFDSEINSDDEEAGRKKYLRMLCKSLKPVYGKTNTENFYVIQTYPTKDMIKDMVTRVAIRTRRELQLTRNDKGRVRAECRGIVPVFSNNYPNEDGLGVGLSGGDGPSGSKSKASGLKLKERNPYTTVEIDVERIYKPENLLWRCATATTVSYFNKNMEELKGANKELYD